MKIYGADNIRFVSQKGADLTSLGNYSAVVCEGGGGVYGPGYCTHSACL